MSYVNVTMNRAERYRINDALLSEADRTFLMQNFGCARKVYNLYVDYLYSELEKCSYTHGLIPDTIRFPEVTYFKGMEQYKYLKSADSLGLANTLQGFRDAVKRFNAQEDHTAYTKRAIRRASSGTEPLSFRGLKGMPKFHSRAHGDFSYTTNCQYPADNNKLKNPTVRLNGNTLYVPTHKTGFPIIVHRRLPRGAKIVHVTFSMEADGSLYASVSYEVATSMNISLREAALNGDESVLEGLKVLGLDYDQEDLYVDSEGRKANYPRYYRRSEEKLAKLRKQLARMEYNEETHTGSKNYSRQLAKIKKEERHIANQRRDFHQKDSTRMSRKYDVVVVEDIDLNAMGQCLSLGKKLHDNGFGMFRDMLAYKLKAKGSCLVKVPRFYPSSKTCHDCGYINPEVVNGVDEWTCPVCGVHHDRDYNAALNIRDKGTEMFLTYFAEQIAAEEQAAAQSEKLKAARIQAGIRRNPRKRISIQ